MLNKNKYVNIRYIFYIYIVEMAEADIGSNFTLTHEILDHFGKIIPPSTGSELITPEQMLHLSNILTKRNIADSHHDNFKNHKKILSTLPGDCKLDAHLNEEKMLEELGLVSDSTEGTIIAKNPDSNPYDIRSVNFTDDKTIVKGDMSPIFDYIGNISALPIKFVVDFLYSKPFKIIVDGYKGKNPDVKYEYINNLTVEMDPATKLIPNSNSGKELGFNKDDGIKYIDETEKVGFLRVENANNLLRCVTPVYPLPQFDSYYQLFGSNVEMLLGKTKKTKQAFAIVIDNDYKTYTFGDSGYAAKNSGVSNITKDDVSDFLNSIKELPEDTAVAAAGAGGPPSSSGRLIDKIKSKFKEFTNRLKAGKKDTKEHIILKRAGDALQALSCLYYNNSTVFVSHDRLAIALAYIVGVPNILYMNRRGSESNTITWFQLKKLATPEQKFKGLLSKLEGLKKKIDEHDFSAQFGLYSTKVKEYYNKLAALKDKVDILPNDNTKYQIIISVSQIILPVISFFDSCYYNIELEGDVTAAEAVEIKISDYGDTLSSNLGVLSKENNSILERYNNEYYEPIDNYKSEIVILENMSNQFTNYITIKDTINKELDVMNEMLEHFDSIYKGGVIVNRNKRIELIQTQAVGLRGLSRRMRSKLNNALTSKLQLETKVNTLKDVCDKLPMMKEIFKNNIQGIELDGRILTQTSKNKINALINIIDPSIEQLGGSKLRSPISYGGSQTITISPASTVSSPESQVYTLRLTPSSIEDNPYIQDQTFTELAKILFLIFELPDVAIDILRTKPVFKDILDDKVVKDVFDRLPNYLDDNTEEIIASQQRTPSPEEVRELRVKAFEQGRYSGQYGGTTVEGDAEGYEPDYTSNDIILLKPVFDIVNSLMDGKDRVEVSQEEMNSYYEEKINQLINDDYVPEIDMRLLDTVERYVVAGVVGEEESVEGERVTLEVLWNIMRAAEEEAGAGAEEEESSAVGEAISSRAGKKRRRTGEVLGEERVNMIGSIETNLSRLSENDTVYDILKIIKELLEFYKDGDARGLRAKQRELYVTIQAFSPILKYIYNNTIREIIRVHGAYNGMYALIYELQDFYKETVIKKPRMQSSGEGDIDLGGDGIYEDSDKVLPVLQSPAAAAAPPLAFAYGLRPRRGGRRKSKSKPNSRKHKTKRNTKRKNNKKCRKTHKKKN
jgi:hypothetical protein